MYKNHSIVPKEIIPYSPIKKIFNIMIRTQNMYKINRNNHKITHCYQIILRRNIAFDMAEISVPGVGNTD